MAVAQQALDDRKQEVATAKRRFQKPFFVERLIFGIADQIKDEINDLAAGKYSPS